VESQSAEQNDRFHLAPKLAASLDLEKGNWRYRFSAQSRGEGMVGFGLHLLVDGEELLGENGFGRSLLIWFTHDPFHYPRGERSRLILYHSLNDYSMNVLVDQYIDADMFSLNEVNLDWLDDRRLIRIRLNNKLLLEHSIPFDGPCKVIALRSLDTAIFKRFALEAIHD